MPKTARPIRVIEVLALAAIAGIALALLLPRCQQTSSDNVTVTQRPASSP